MAKTDIFALGMCMFECIFKEHAYSGNHGKYAHHEDDRFKYLWNSQETMFWTEVLKSEKNKEIVKKMKSENCDVA